MRTRLVQRCDIRPIEDGGEIKIRYQYMGMSVFECGDQSKSLKRIFERGMAIHKVEAYFAYAEKNINIYLVAGKHFPLARYQPFVEDLINDNARTSEPTWMKENIIKAKYPLEEKYHNQVDAWFDFENDVILILDIIQAQQVVSALSKIEKIWNTPDPPELKEFKKQLEKVKRKLKKAGMEWYSLDSVRQLDGEYKVWLNPSEQQKHNCGWFNIKDLELWAKNKGQIVISV